jgi:hypothetical protein
MSIFSSIVKGVGSFFAGDAAADAAKKQADIAKKTLAEQTKLTAPYREAGQRGATAFEASAGLGDEASDLQAVEDFRSSPNYRLNYDNMLRDAREDTLAFAAGSDTTGVRSGNTVRALSENAAKISNQLFGNYQDNLFRLTDVGLRATGAQAGFVGTAGDRRIDAAGAYGDAKAAQYLGIADSGASMFDDASRAFGGRMGSSSYAPTDFTRIY